MNLEKENLNSVKDIIDLSTAYGLNYLVASCPKCRYQLASVNIEFINNSDIFLYNNLYEQGWIISLEDSCDDISMKVRKDCCPNLGITKLLEGSEPLSEVAINDEDTELIEKASIIKIVTPEELIRAAYETSYKYIAVFDEDGIVQKSEELDPNNIKTYKRWIKNTPNGTIKLINK